MRNGERLAAKSTKVKRSLRVRRERAVEVAPAFMQNYLSNPVSNATCIVTLRQYFTVRTCRVARGLLARQISAADVSEAFLLYLRRPRLPPPAAAELLLAPAPDESSSSLITSAPAGGGRFLEATLVR